MANHDKTFTVPLPQRQHDLLEHVAAVTGSTKAEGCRIALADYFARLGADPDWQAKLNMHEEQRRGALAALGFSRPAGE